MKAHAFFTQYGIDHLAQRQKYYTKAAELYKEKVSVCFHVFDLAHCLESWLLSVLVPSIAYLLPHPI